MKDDTLYLIHIGECIDRIESYTQGMTKEAFLAAEMVQDAVIRNLQTMAESTQHLSATARASQPRIDWRKMPAFATFSCTTISASIRRRSGRLSRTICLFSKTQWM